MREQRPPGSVRGAVSNDRPYRDWAGGDYLDLALSVAFDDGVHIVLQAAADEDGALVAKANSNIAPKFRRLYRSEFEIIRCIVVT